MKNFNKLLFGTPYFRNVSIGIVLVFAFSVTFFIEAALQYNKRTLISGVRSSLHVILNTTSEGLKIWLTDKKNFIKQFGTDKYLVRAVQRLLTEQPSPQALLASKNLNEIRQFLAVYEDEEKKNGFFVINPDLITIVSMRDENLGTPNFIAEERPDLIRRVFQGETLFIPPLRSDVHLEKNPSTSVLPPTIFFAAPVIDSDKNIIAIATVRLDSTKNFSRIIQLGRLSNTGETYAFNEQGKLLSESRFTEQLRQIGLVKSNEQSILNIHITDPGRNLLLERPADPTQSRQPYTMMAESALRGESGENMKGYRDYRGVPVYGVWRWDDSLGLGLTSEVDIEEALGPYLLLRRTVFGILAIVLLSAAAGILFTLVFGERAYRMMKTTQDNLEEQINQRTGELQESEKNLLTALKISKAATRAKSTFLANMSHEVRTPMNAIIGFTDIVLQTDLEAIQRKHLTTVSHSAKSLLSLLSDILYISKLEEGKMKLEEVVFMLPKIIEEVFSTLSMKILEKKITLHLHYDEELPNCFVGDHTRLKQVLLNLIGNAVKFTDTGSVSLFIKPAEEEHFLHFIVKDTGIGIPAERLKTIFSPFAQADASTTRKHGGTGLGTAISRQLVECMAGRIWAESEVGKGSVFHFLARLPKKKCITPCATGEVRADVEFRATRRLNILLAEDIPENVELASIRLAAVGHHITVAVNGREAVQMIAADNKRAYHLVLMDIHMPEMDGLEATRRIRKLETGSDGHIPIIALSASVLVEEKNDCLEAGMDGFVAKPIDFAKLFAEISRVVPKDSGDPIDDLTVSPGYMGSTIPQLPGLDTKSGIRLWRDSKLYLKNLRGFARKHGQDGERVRQALEKNDLKTARVITHSLKGVAGNLAVIDVAATAGQLNGELKALTGNFSPRVEELISVLEIAVTSIKRINHQTDEAREKNVKGCDTKAVRKILIDLQCALDLDDLDRVESLLERLKEYCAESQITALVQQVADFEFRAAEENLRNLASILDLDLSDHND
jgi:signal transduction histidine kinase/CheY-like chemotaxis protein